MLFILGLTKLFGLMLILPTDTSCLTFNYDIHNDSTTSLGIVDSTFGMGAGLNHSSSTANSLQNDDELNNNTTANRRLAGLLKVQGRQIVDGNGNAVMWRGINMDCYYYDLWNRPDAQLKWYASQTDIQYLKNLGITAIRLALDWSYFDTTLGYDLIDQYLSWCSTLGIYIILDMHVVPPDTEFGHEQIWGNNNAKQQLINLWKTIATRYRDQQWIGGYDLYNEPRPSNAQEWWDLSKLITSGIRLIDKNHIIIVETATFDYQDFQLLNDANVVYSYHDYEPFYVTHAGVDWGLESPNPKIYSYPGNVLQYPFYVGYSPEARSYTKQSLGWVFWDSGPLKPVANDGPPGAKVEWATITLAASGNTGNVYFDDIQVIKNGWRIAVTNPGFEEEYSGDPNRPRTWYYWASEDGDFTGGWSTQYFRNSTGSMRSLQLSGSSGIATWSQSNGYYTAPLFRVKRGDVFRVRGWIYAPNNKGGDVSLGLNYLSGAYKYYNITTLQEYVQPVLDWGKVNNVPLYVGEFGSLPTAPNNSRKYVIRDKIKIMNEEGLHWSLWTYRDPKVKEKGFGLVHGNVPDKSVETILKNGMI